MATATDKDISGFDPDQQDAILAEMQAAALVIYRGAGTSADFAHAVTAFARAAKARVALRPSIYQRWAQRRAEKWAAWNPDPL